MIVKIIWYIFSLLIILLVLISAPTNNTMNITVSQNQVFNFRSNKLLVQQFIGFSVFIFLLLTILLFL